MSSEAVRLYRFEGFDLEPRERRLVHGGQPVALTPKAFELLLLLIERRGRVVSKSDLLDALWGGRIVAESNLTKHVWMLRQVLGESREGGRCIETVSKFGYRFVAPVTCIAGDEGEVAGPVEAKTDVTPQGLAAPEPVAATAPPGFARRWMALAGVGLAAVLVAGGVVLLPKVGGPAAAFGQASGGLALVDPVNLSGAPGAAWIGQALTETLGAEVTLDRRLRIPPGELMRSAEADLPPPGAGGYAAATLAKLRRRVGADYVLSGGYLVFESQGAPRVRLDLTLQDARSGAVLANLSRAGAVAELPTLVEQTGVELRKALRSGGPQTAAATTSTAPSTEVMRDVGEGLGALHRYEAARARDAFLQAVAQAPSYAPAYAYLSEAWTQLGYKTKARAAIEQASAYSAGLPEPMRLRITAQQQAARFDWPAAAGTLRRLVALRGGDPQDQLRLIDVLLSGGKPDQAQQVLAGLQRQNPDDGLIDLADAKVAAAKDDNARRAAAARRALAWARAHDLPGVAADAQTQLGVALTSSDPKGAQAALLQALAGYRQVQNPRGEATALVCLGNLLADREPLASRKAYENALGQFQAIGDLSGMAGAQADIATMLWTQGDLDGARTALANVLDLRRRTEDIAGQAWTLSALAIIEADDNAGDQVLAHFREAIALDQAAGATSHLGFSLFSMADVQRLRGDLAAAQASCAQARAALAQNRSDPNSASVDLECAMIELDRGDVEPALAHARATQAAAAARSEAMTVANVDLLVGQVALERRRADLAAAALEKARAGFATGDMVSGEVIALQLLALNDTALGHAQASRTHSAQAADLRRRVTQKQEVMAGDIAAAQLRGLTGARPAAIADLRSLAADAERRHWRGWALEARLAAARLTAPGVERDAAVKRLVADAQRSGFGWILQRAQAIGPNAT